MYPPPWRGTQECPLCHAGNQCRARVVRATKKSSSRRSVACHTFALRSYPRIATILYDYRTPDLKFYFLCALNRKTWRNPTSNANMTMMNYSKLSNFACRWNTLIFRLFRITKNRRIQFIIYRNCDYHNLSQFRPRQSDFSYLCFSDNCVIHLRANCSSYKTEMLKTKLSVPFLFIFPIPLYRCRKLNDWEQLLRKHIMLDTWLDSYNCLHNSF